MVSVTDRRLRASSTLCFVLSRTLSKFHNLSGFNMTACHGTMSSTFLCLPDGNQKLCVPFALGPFSSVRIRLQLREKKDSLTEMPENDLEDRLAESNPHVNRFGNKKLIFCCVSSGYCWMCFRVILSVGLCDLK